MEAEKLCLNEVCFIHQTSSRLVKETKIKTSFELDLHSAMKSVVASTRICLHFPLIFHVLYDERRNLIYGKTLNIEILIYRLRKD